MPRTSIHCWQRKINTTGGDCSDDSRWFYIMNRLFPSQQLWKIWKGRPIQLCQYLPCPFDTFKGTY
ncbi:hypothetical protein DPMN_135045 [Dreissena polymorpha]|uniref:Uncharacterized protein n=1 Tax=Dreissena polymorpha TaxID=45954 RepID=A0A9D4JB94_DREPO|nr:hypothetical protein DPMN_135045 [Dreissena polymorpha]